MKLNPNVLGTRQDRQYPREGTCQKDLVPAATAAGGSEWGGPPQKVRFW